jgi:HNH endonuclease
MGKRPTIHRKIKEVLGYDPASSDEEVWEDWDDRTSKICKPCWELKYCPYGPFVEQSPLLPSTAESIREHNKYLQECLDTGLVGSVQILDDESRARYLEWLEDESVLISQAFSEVRNRRFWQQMNGHESVDQFLKEDVSGPLPPIEQYRIPFDQHSSVERSIDDIPDELRNEIEEIVANLRAKYERALQEGKLDDRMPLEPARRAYFEQTLKRDPAELPESIPPEFELAACQEFGHICPVFFVAESITETAALRRLGRQEIPYAMKSRIVRRDNYTCQECGEHLMDHEVEFDHLIPVSRGGSSEESNLRLTCFDCNRDKSDDFSPSQIRERLTRTEERARLKGKLSEE